MSKTIPASYQLHVHSWEDDTDHHDTEILHGLTKEDVEFYLELLENFRSRSDGSQDVTAAFKVLHRKAICQK